jgi:hypothetical protein
MNHWIPLSMPASVANADIMELFELAARPLLGKADTPCALS